MVDGLNYDFVLTIWTTRVFCGLTRRGGRQTTILFSGLASPNGNFKVWLIIRGLLTIRLVGVLASFETLLL